MLFKFFIRFTLRTIDFSHLNLLKPIHKDNFLFIEDVLKLFYHFFHIL